ncbi:MAG: hypothetical protein WCV90_05295 [Candidatus Woesearchaeota archaeon]
MKYQRIDNKKIEIFPEMVPIRELLLAIAKVSYETAVPRGLGHLQHFQAPSTEVSLEGYLQYEGKTPVMLLMDYIAGRDCRTKVFLGREGKWYLDSYAFQQRKVTSEEFLKGVVRDPAEGFLDKVIQEIERKGDN